MFFSTFSAIKRTFLQISKSPLPIYTNRLSNNTEAILLYTKKSSR